MSKHAVVGLTRTAANELAPYNIRVNAVLPGTINTRMMRQIEANSGNVEDYQSATVSSIPMGRYGEPEEVAAGNELPVVRRSILCNSFPLHLDGGMVGQ